MSTFEQTISGLSTKLIGTNKDVKIAPPTGISVLIVGAGVGGLVAALECTRKGHSVRIFEREAALSSAGDLFTLGASGRRWMCHWPDMAKEYDQISMKGMFMEYHKHSGETVIPPLSFSEMHKGVPPPPGATSGLPSPAAGPSMVTQLRPLFHAMLYRQVQRLGIEVVCNKLAIDYFETEERGGVVTADGDRTEADIVIAADGIGSKAQTLILGEQIRGMYSGHSVFRTAYPIDVALKDPLVRKHFDLHDGKPILRAFFGPETHGMVLSTSDTITWAIDHKDIESTGSESWRKAVGNEQVLRIMDETPGWGEIFKALVKTAPPGSIVNYPLIFRNPQPMWTSHHGRVITLGDSAHTFLPTSGNGATQAIEDAVTIASCLQLAGSRTDVPTAAGVYATLRFERVANAQRLGFVNKQRVQGINWDAVKADLTKLRPLVPKWIYTHDPEKYVYDNYAKVVDDSTSFVNTNVPPGSSYKPWTMDELLEDLRNERVVKMDGDWT